MKKSEILAALKDARDCLYQSETDLLWRRLDIFDALVEGGEGVSADYAAKMIADYTATLLEVDQFRREIATLGDKLPARPFPACNCD